MKSFEYITNHIKRICDERDLAEWFFDQTNLKLTKHEGTTGPAWNVKLIGQKPPGKGHHNTPETIVGHSYVSAFEAIRRARTELALQKLT